MIWWRSGRREAIPPHVAGGILVNVAVGYGIAVSTQAAVFPWFGLHISISDDLAIAAELLRPGSRARNERGALGITKFLAIGRQVWPNREPTLPDDIAE